MNSGRIAVIEALRGKGLFCDADINFARFICREAGPDAGYELYLAAALVSNAVLVRKHICLDTTMLAVDLNSWFADLTDAGQGAEALRHELRRLPVPENWLEKLAAHTLAAGAPGEFKPLIIKNELIYLHRTWLCEKQLAVMIKSRGEGVDPGFNAAAVAGRITAVSARFFSGSLFENNIDWQQAAVFAALRNRFAIITGGPGTGKTTVAAAIVALLFERDLSLRIALCAPTGKAQARLQESLLIETEILHCRPEVIQKTAAVPACTIHRLLGARPDSEEFKYNRKNQLALDVLIVDEASMISQSLMSGLLEALPPHTKVVLLGDMDQLASVESGMVLRDLCLASEINHFSPRFRGDFKLAVNGSMPELPSATGTSSLADCTVELQISRRFDPDKGIGLVAAAIKALPAYPENPAADAIINAACSDSTAQIKVSPLPDFRKGGLERVLAEVWRGQRVTIGGAQEKMLPDYLNAENVEAAYEIFRRFRILCSHRRGMYGAEAVNLLVEKNIRVQNNLAEFYKGKPVMITENCPMLNLFNGDIGLVWPDENGRLKAYFPSRDGQRENGFFSVEISTLPMFETAFAMTVHKSQGSGFQNVLLILTPDQNSPILTRELVYTAITRAEKHAGIWSSREVLAASIRRRTRRCSRLQDYL
ncbi:MAG: exodeoxyribonuclease V subunit alpha [Victivallaceae bacterium]|jgi:exodeoxyribonuclease V alpha subunit